jgi:AbiV family abortive infection protein
MADETSPTKRTLTPEAMMYLENLVQGDPVLGNAFRLMNDASFLFEGGRYSSTVALAVLCLEEIGKYLLALWSKDSAFAYDKRRLHQSKQLAIAALFVSDRMRQEAYKRKVDFSDLGSPEKMNVLAEAIRFAIDKESFLAGTVNSGVIQIIKHSGIYYDEEFVQQGIEPGKITGDNATEMMRMCSRAFMVLTEPKSIGLAADVYPVLEKKPQKQPT